MSRVNRETLDKLQAFFDTLEPEVQSKCALCNETLVHIVKLAEVQTGAGTKTVCRELTTRINDGSAPGDIVGDRTLEDKVKYADFGKSIKSGISAFKIPVHNEQDRETKNIHQPEQSEQPEITPIPKQESKPENKQKPKQEQPDRRTTDNFINAYNELKYAIQGEKMAGWSDMTKDTAIKHMGYLIDLINIGR